MVGPSKVKVLEGVCMPLCDAKQPARVPGAVCMRMPRICVPTHMCVPTHDMTRRSHPIMVCTRAAMVLHSAVCDPTAN